MITKQEHVSRFVNLQRKVSENGLEAFLISSEESIYYLTGISYRPLERPFFIIVWAASPATLLVPALEKTHLQAAPNVGQVQTYWDYPSPAGQGWAEQLLKILGRISQLGIEPALTQEVSRHLSQFLPRGLPLIEQLRLVKSPAEVSLVRRAARYADLGVQKTIAASYYGVSELELFAQGRGVQIQIMKDAEYDVLTTNVLVGAWPAPLSAQPHGVPTIADRLKEGPHIALSLLRVNGYAAECERTYFLAPPAPEVEKAFAAMQEARRRAFALVRPGTSCAEVDAAANGFLRQEGYGDHLLHRTGHGLGLGNHEGPWVAEGSEDVLQEKMLISIEPGIYLPGVGGVRHSDTVLVTRDGYELLTHHPTDLGALIIRSPKPLARLRGRMVRRAVGIR
jgi:Xaa-Pro aminopeptidase